MRRADLAAGVFLIILALFLVADLFFHPGRSITFDGHVHITTIAQFFNALKAGEFPAKWADGFANYGHPLPLVAQQTTSYLGAFFQIFTQNAVQSYNLVTFIGAALSALLLYRFLRFSYTPWSSAIAASTFMFAPYRITNIYTRGAIPEFFAAVFIPLGLIGLYEMLKEKKWIGGIWFSLAVAGLVLTHPMVLVIGSLILGPYAMYLLWPLPKNVRSGGWLAVFGFGGLMSTMYYLVPLLVEIRYFNYGNITDRFRGSVNFLKLENFILERWSYYGATHPGPRSEALFLGSFEAMILLVCGGAALMAVAKNRASSMALIPWMASAVLSIFLMLPVSVLLYQNFFLLNNIQYPWRNLAALMFIPPVFLAWGLDTSRKYKEVVGVVFLIMVLIVRLPQLYGKNFMQYDLTYYNFTSANLHTANLNTVWTGDVRDYPIRSEKFGVIDGRATITPIEIKNSYRSYHVVAESDARLADYTFYFPGWTARVDGQQTEIQYQDPEHRGYITYNVPKGEHRVTLQFEDTLLRLLGKALTMLTLITATVLWWGRRWISQRGWGLSTE